MNRLTIAVAIATTLTPLVGGAEVQYGFDVGVGTTDNIHRTPTAEESETIRTAGANLLVVTEGGRVEAVIDADLSYFDYTQNSYDSEVLGIAYVDIRGQIIPDRFEWIFADSFGQRELDPFLTPTPENRESVNYLLTGPDLILRLGSQTSLLGLGRYARADYEESNFDDQRILGGVALIRELSSSQRLSLNGTTERVEFENPEAGSDYDRNSAFTRYELEGARTRLSVDGGYVRVHDFGDDIGSPLFEVDLARDISERSTVALRAGITTSDSASALLAETISGSCVAHNTGRTSSADVYKVKHGMLCWQFGSRRTTAQIWGRYEQDEYASQSELDRDSIIFHAGIQRILGPRVTIDAVATMYDSEYDANGQTDDEIRLGLYLSWNLVGRFYLEADIEHFNRDSSNPILESDETRAFVRIAWRHLRGSEQETQ